MRFEPFHTTSGLWRWTDQQIADEEEKKNFVLKGRKEADVNGHSLVFVKSNHRAIILVATLFVQHTGMNYCSDGLVNVIRTEHLQKIDHTSIGWFQFILRKRSHIDHGHTLATSIVFPFDDIEPTSFTEGTLLTQIFGILSWKQLAISQMALRSFGLLLFSNSSKLKNNGRS